MKLVESQRDKVSGESRYQFGAAFFSEFLGTMILVFAGAGSVVATGVMQLAWGLPLIAAVFGATVAVLGLSPRPLSKAYINPAVSLAHVAAGRLRASSLVPFMVSQTMGAITAAFALGLIFPASMQSRFLGSTLLPSTTTPWLGILLESAGTFGLCCSILFIPPNSLGSRGKPVVVGTTLFVLILLLGPFTSASLNPARSLGPALASNHLDNLEVYLVGPSAGGLASGLVGRIRK